MGRFSKAFVFLVLVGAIRLSADEIDLGYLALTASDDIQTVSLFNYTGTSSGGSPYGCSQDVGSTQYNVCTPVTIQNWSLTINYTASAGATNLSPSPLVFTSNGSSGDYIPPTVSADDPYTGVPGTPWSLEFDQQVSCLPCDAQITSIILTGTLDPSVTSLNLYNGSVTGPYILDPLNTQSFSFTWNVLASDPTAYTDSPGFLGVSTDLLFNNQAPAPVAPEPGSLYLLLTGAIGAGFLRRIIPG